MPLTSSRYNKIAGSDRIEVEDMVEQPGLIKETFDVVRDEVDNEFIDSIYEQWVVSKTLSTKQLKGLVNFHNKLVKD